MKKLSENKALDALKIDIYVKILIAYFSFLNLVLSLSFTFFFSDFEKYLRRKGERF